MFMNTDNNYRSAISNDITSSGVGGNFGTNMINDYVIDAIVLKLMYQVTKGRPQAYKVLSLTSVVLSVLTIVYRYNCSVVEQPTNGAEYFLFSVIKTYILKDECAQSVQVENLTKADSVFILAIIILVSGFINFLLAVTMILVVNQEAPVKNVDIFIYVYLASSLALLVVDLTLGVHFGMDHEFLKDKLRLNSAGLWMNYEIDMIRLGALLLMSTALKGYIGHAINIVLLVLLTVYVIRYQREFNEHDHSAQKLSILRAFEPSNKIEEPWSPLRNEIFSYSRGPSINGLNNEHVFSNAPMRETLLTDISRGQSNPAFNGDGPHRVLPVKDISILPDSPRNRSHLWLQNSGAGMGSRPFSYLEDRQRPVPLKSPSSAANKPPPQWRRDADAWVAAPPVPEPDYSPPPRKLKSALKTNNPY